MLRTDPRWLSKGELFAESQSDDPGPEEIRAMCLKIQAEWSPIEERYRRFGYGFVTEREAAAATWQPPMIRGCPAI